MRYGIVIVWALILGQIVGYIGGALNHEVYDPKVTFFISIIAGLLVIWLGFIMQPKKIKKEL